MNKSSRSQWHKVRICSFQIFNAIENLAPGQPASTGEVPRAAGEQCLHLRPVVAPTTYSSTSSNQT